MMMIGQKAPAKIAVRPSMERQPIRKPVPAPR
jgi:hypothetical protein